MKNRQMDRKERLRRLAMETVDLSKVYLTSSIVDVTSSSTVVTLSECTFRKTNSLDLCTQIIFY